VKHLNKHFLAGVVAGVVLLAVFPQLNPRQMLAKKKG
jgi:hypothetical protein